MRKYFQFLTQASFYLYSILAHLLLLFLIGWVVCQPSSPEPEIAPLVCAPLPKNEGGGKSDGDPMPGMPLHGIQSTEISVRVSLPKENFSPPKIQNPQPMEWMTQASMDIPMDHLLEKEKASLGNLLGAGGTDGKGHGHGSHGLGGKGKGIFGMTIEGERLAVILDVSGSMRNILPQVSREIKFKFPNAEFLFVPGCSFMPLPPFMAAHSESTPIRLAWMNGEELSRQMTKLGFPNVKHDHFFVYMNQAVAHASTLEVDAVWIFADYQDPVDAGIVSELLEKYESTPVKIYLHSVERQPSLSLLDLCKQTHGNFTVKKLK